MNILIVKPKAKIPIVKYGGIERIIWDLGNELQKLGHKVSFLVAQGSTCDFAEIIYYDPALKISDQIPSDFDVVHFHDTKHETNIPNITTIHGNRSLNEVLDINTVFLTKNHAENHNSKTFVFNGLDWNNYPIVNLNRTRKHFHFLGKARWKVKNLNGAINTVIKAGENLEILGGKKWNWRNLKSNTLNKLNRKINYHGMVDNLQKTKISEQSKGHLFPVLWNEPFGLAIIESLYCGAPVFGTPYGSLPELISDEVGFLSSSMDAVIDKMLHNNFDPLVCHDFALEKFNSQVMAKKYVKLYERVIAGKQLNEEIPCRILKSEQFVYE